MKRYTCYLSLGANLGERGETLREALRQLSQLPETRLTAVSPFMRRLRGENSISQLSSMPRQPSKRR